MRAIKVKEPVTQNEERIKELLRTIEEAERELAELSGAGLDGLPRSRHGAHRCSGEDVRTSEARFDEQAMLLDIAHEAILVTDLEGCILYWNKGAERTYGWAPVEALGRNVGDLLFNGMPQLEGAMNLLLANGEWHGEMAARAKKGTEVMIELRWTLLRDKQGAPKSIFAVHSDVTEKKRLEEQYLRAQRMENIGILAGGIAHDLNNILAPILMSIEVLREEAQKDEDRAWLDTLQTSAQRGADLVKQVLAFARGMEGKRMTLNPAHLLRDIQKIVKETFPKSIRFTLQVAPDSWTVSGEPTQLNQVLMNLCVNARDAMPNGGELKVTLENAVLDDVYVRLNSQAHPGRYVVIGVSDTGIGIPAEVQERMFDPFFTTKEVGKGTGLGLPTSLSIVKMHGGFVDVESKPGRGAHFKVYLPATEKAQPSGSVLPPGSSGIARDNGELVLLVDDEESVRFAARKTLEAFGYRVLVASNGAEAVALYAQNAAQIALVITDMSMPIMDGNATISALRLLNSDIRILGSSGVGSGVLRDGNTPYFLSKPYTGETLLRAVALSLDGK